LGKKFRKPQGGIFLTHTVGLSVLYGFAAVLNFIFDYHFWGRVSPGSWRWTGTVRWGDGMFI